MSNSSVLVGSGNNGDFVHQHQEMSAKQDFRNVSKKWLDKCITFDQGLEKLYDGRSQTEDFEATITQFRPALTDSGRFVIRDQASGRDFRPTHHALNQLSRWANVGNFLPNKLYNSTDTQDHETLVRVFENGLRHLDSDKNLFWRCRQDGTLRAVLSNRYMEVNNEWFLKTLQEIIPGGMLSHWRGDSDTIYGNILIPDSIREESDSDYGGMLSIGNSEVGTRHLFSLPSVFRAICMNGCIWDQKKGESLKMRHNGEPDYEVLYVAIRQNLENQIPLLPRGIGQLLDTRAKKWDSGSIYPLFAALATEFKIAREPISKVLGAYQEELLAADSSRNNLFGVINAFTRAGQGLSNEQWYSFDIIGGKLAGLSGNEWDGLRNRARAMKTETVDKVLGLAS
jgi:hypothetical protein